jgi:hypothetical protein
LRRRILGIRFAAKKTRDDLFFQPLRLGGIGRFDHPLFVMREFFAIPLKLLFEFTDEFQNATLFAGRQILDFVDNRSGIHGITLPFDFHKGKAARGHCHRGSGERLRWCRAKRFYQESPSIRSASAFTARSNSSPSMQPALASKAARRRSWLLGLFLNSDFARSAEAARRSAERVATAGHVPPERGI